MTETMYDCYFSQFECMKKILSDRDKIFAGFSDFYKMIHPDRIYLIGSGTSNNACNAASAFLEEVLGMEVTVLAPSRADKLYGERPLVILVSQGGRSTNTVSAVHRMQSQGIKVVTLTDPKETPVGASADFPVLLAANQELIGPKTRGYAATVLSLYLLALEAGLAAGSISAKQYEDYSDSLLKMTEQGNDWFERCEKFYHENKEDLKTATHYMFAGKGTRGHVAKEAALKVLETLCFAANGYEFEEFLHGPACCTDESFALFLYLSDDEDQARMLKAAEIVRRATKNSYVISHDPRVEGTKALYLPGSEKPYLSPFSDVLFAQLISAVLTEEMGRSRHPAIRNIFQEMGTKIPQD